jgi:hypothetical protein
MQITRMIGFWLVLAITIGACIFAVWRLRRNRLLAAGVGVLCALLAFGVGVGTWAWATAPAVPEGIEYDNQGWYPEWSPAALSPGTCVSTTTLRHGLDWPLRRVGRITWVSWNSETSVGPSGRGYPVFEAAEGNAIFVEVRPGCYLAYVSV